MDPIVWAELITAVAIICILALMIGNIVAAPWRQKIGWLIAGLISIAGILYLATGAVSQWR